MNKEELRKKYLTIRKKILDRDKKNEAITKKVKELEIYKEANTIALYCSLPDEVNTDELIEDALNNHKVVLLPRTNDSDIVFSVIKSMNEPFLKGKFGVLEPLNKEVYKKDKIDLIIVPGVSFDREGNRLGYGKGYYDRYLTGSNLKTIGICFSEQLTEHIPNDDNDIKIDVIVTDKEVIKTRTLKK